MKPILYVDVDGVLFGEYDGHIQLRPNAVGFLRWCMERFQVRWLTGWDEQSLHRLFAQLYALDIVHRVPHVNWKEVDRKIDAVDCSEDFYWIEDRKPPKRIEKACDSAGYSRFIEVNPRGAKELYKIRYQLKKRITSRP